MTTFCQTGKPDIEYPRQWEYRLIGFDCQAIRGAAAEIISREYQISPANSSKGGKYHSMRLLLTVDSEETRDGYFRRLQDHPAIKMVI